MFQHLVCATSAACLPLPFTVFLYASPPGDFHRDIQDQQFFTPVCYELGVGDLKGGSGLRF